MPVSQAMTPLFTTGEGDRAGLKGLVLTLAGNNLHYFTEVIGLSPEVGASSTYSGSFNTYPPIRKFSIGCKVTL